MKIFISSFSFFRQKLSLCRISLKSVKRFAYLSYNRGQAPYKSKTWVYEGTLPPVRFHLFSKATYSSPKQVFWSQFDQNRLRLTQVMRGTNFFGNSVPGTAYSVTSGQRRTLISSRNKHLYLLPICGKTKCDCSLLGVKQTFFRCNTLSEPVKSG